jgi:hypothetical protein
MYAYCLLRGATNENVFGAADWLIKGTEKNLKFNNLR